MRLDLWSRQMDIQVVNRDKLLQLLNNLHIDYRYIEHPAMNSVSDRERYAVKLPSQLLKNMLLKNSSGRHFYLYILDGEKRADLKALAREIGDSRLSLATPGELKQLLGLEPGEVTPFALLNDPAHKIKVLIDASVDELGPLGFHPLVNTATVCISLSALHQFLHYCTHASQQVGDVAGHCG